MIWFKTCDDPANFNGVAMKTLMVSLFVLSTLTANAGIIRSTESNDFIKIELSSDQKTVLIEREVNGAYETIEVELEDVNIKKGSLRLAYKDGATFSLPYGGTTALFAPDIPTGFKFIFFIPSLAIDTLFLPVTLTLELAKPKSFTKFKKDIKVVEAALKSADYTKDVSAKRFKRFNTIFDYFFTEN